MIIKIIKQKSKYLIPPSLKKTLKYSLYALEDTIDFLKGKKSEYPPKRLNFVGSHDFVNVGNEFFRYFKKKADLKPSDSVLDIGCGIGRMAIPLSKYLAKGHYEGFDIDKRGINWCQKNITPKHPHFHFQYVDIFNKYYNKKGGIHAHEFIFPYKNETFDFIFATSVFTHMLTLEVIQYLKETQRVLKPKGTAFLTFFIIDETAKKNIENNTARCKLSLTDDHIAWYSHKNMPEAEVGYEKKWILEKLKQLQFNTTIYPGSWAKRNHFLSYQDIIIAREQAHGTFQAASEKTRGSAETSRNELSL